MIDTEELEKPESEEQEEIAPELSLDPGEIAPYNASPYPDADLTKEERDELQAIVELIGRKDIAARRWEVEDAWESRFFWRGYQYLLPRNGGGWIYLPFGTDYQRLRGRTGAAAFFGYETNIYTAWGEIISAVLARRPKVRFMPQCPFDDADITAATAASDYAQVFSRSNDLDELHAQLVNYLGTDERALIVVDHIKDAQRFGREDPVSDEPLVPETEYLYDQIKIYLNRHGETEKNLQDEPRGRSEIGIDERGERESMRAGEWLKNKGIGLIVSSPVERALESAREIQELLGVELEIDDRLASLDLGNLADEEPARIGEKISEAFETPDQNIPGSEESPAEFDRRIREVLLQYLEGEKVILFVTHDSVISSIFRQLRGGDMPASALVGPGGVAGVSPNEDGTYSVEALYPYARKENETGQKRGAPRGREIARVFGKLEHRVVPINVNSQSEIIAIAVAYEIDIAEARARYPKYADKIKPGPSGIGENELDRIARINVNMALEASYMTGDATVRDCTVQEVWVRPAMFMGCNKVSIRSSFFKKFPEGCKITLASNVVVGARNEQMDDHCTLVHATSGSGQNRLSLFGKLKPIQKRLNNWIDLFDQFFIRTVPRRYLPQPILDAERLSQIPNAPGQDVPYQSSQLPPNMGLEQLIAVEPAPQPQPAMFQFVMLFIKDLPQQLIHAMPSLFGDNASTETVGGIAIQRDQALGCLSSPWGRIQQATCSYVHKAARLAAQCRRKSIDGVDEEGAAIRIQVGDLKGNVLAYPEADSNFPESWVQRQARYQAMIMAATSNPLFAKWLGDPQNVLLAKDAAGYGEVVIPGASSYEKQLGELELLKKSGPVPNPDYENLKQQIAQGAQSIQASHMQGVAVPDEEVQALSDATQKLSQTPPLISSVPIRETDNNLYEAAACEKFINSPRGRRMADGSPEDKAAFQNITLHYFEHKAKIPSPEPETKPISVSANVKDMPPEVAAQAYMKAGLESSPEKVLEGKEIQTELKKSSKIGGPPVPQII